MENYGGEEEVTENKSIEQGGLSSSEEAFMQGYLEDGNVPECAECGGALDDDKTLVSRDIEEEKLNFCSSTCADEFEESV
jgi:hypothetical protein